MHKRILFFVVIDQEKHFFDQNKNNKKQPLNTIKAGD
jgi:hypothetical protein